MPNNQDDIKRDKAARIIQRVYRNYRKRKQETTLKPGLLTKASSATGGLFANIKNKEESITFKKSGSQTLFPVDASGNSYINIALLESYLKKGVDIRQFVLEAHLDGRLAEASLITFELMRSALNRFAKEPNFELFKIHQNGELTEQAKTLLLPNTITLTALLKQNSIILNTRKIRALLSSLPESENVFCHFDMPLLEIYKIARIKVSSELYDYDKSDAYPDKNFINQIANLINGKDPDKIGVTYDRYDLEEKINENIYSLMNTEERLAVDQESGHSKSEKINAYLKKQPNLFEQIMRLNRLFFYPKMYKKPDGTYGGRVIITGVAYLNMILEYATGRNSKEILAIKAMLDILATDVNFYATETAPSRPAQISHPNIPTRTKAHDLLTNEFDLLFHDFYYHYFNLFLLRARIPEAYKINLMFVNAINNVTGSSQTSMATDILDFPSEIFMLERTYSKQDQYRRLLKLNFADKSNHLHANSEYVFIILSDLIKNKENYLAELKFPSTTNDDKKFQNIEFLFSVILQEYHKAKPLLAIFKEPVYISMRNDLFKATEKYSHSLGSFMFSLIQRLEKIPNENDLNEILKICDKLHELEISGQKIFSWNKQDGIMLNLPVDGKNLSFRFRYLPSKTSQHPSHYDYRHDRKYTKHDVVRLFSHEPNWWNTLVETINENIKKLEHPSQKAESTLAPSR